MCDICYRPACNGECVHGPTDEDLIALADDARWQPGREEPVPDPACAHEWTYDVDADGGDVDVSRRCARCGGCQTQAIFREPEPCNCYVPGQGWTVV